MNKTPGGETPGVSVHGSERETSKPKRAILQASLHARLRLEALQFGRREVLP